MVGALNLLLIGSHNKAGAPNGKNDLSCITGLIFEISRKGASLIVLLNEQFLISAAAWTAYFQNYSCILD